MAQKHASAGALSCNPGAVAARLGAGRSAVRRQTPLRPGVTASHRGASAGTASVMMQCRGSPRYQGENQGTPNPRTCLRKSLDDG